MRCCYISDIASHEGEEVSIRGWLQNKRSSGKVHFLMIRDGTGTIQGVVSRDAVAGEVFALYDSLTRESSITVTGTVRPDARAPGGCEIAVSDVTVVHIAAEYPITPKEHGTAFLMDHRHLWIRSARQTAILRVRSEIVRACRQFFDDRGFVLLDAPIFTPVACEGTTTLFQTDYFYGKQAYLSQSGQLYAEAGAAALGKVYCFGPTFRAEKSKTRRHLTEFWMVEPEVAYAELDDIMTLAEEMVTYIVQQVLERRATELEQLGREVGKLRAVRPPFPRLRYEEALRLLEERGVQMPWGGDFGGDEETLLSEAYDMPLIIHRYPREAKPFYMKDDPTDPRVVLNIDVLAPEGYGEIIGGSQREDDLERLLRKMEEQDVPSEDLRWYVDLRRYGSVPHAGFGLGVERTLSWICGLSHVRETIPFPRMMHRLYP